ncbi:gliding motility-associated C-terminal domain-containing protein [Chitinophaga sp. NPDC101104]|uniref:DUF7927 domain-containing protein n=1 Tax=Chitinophaga sp. NPDC101104 TaxID=3390561 RepID=UPI003D028B3A
MARMLRILKLSVPSRAKLPGFLSAALRALLPAALLLALSGNLRGQSCTGSLGDPVFLETFGTAPSTARPSLGPALPAGMTTYIQYYPGLGGRPMGPYPGQYVISNTTRGYNNTYFVDRPDHTTGDFTGRCMVVDAEATPGRFYERTITGLCAGTTFEFSAWIMNINPSRGVANPSLRFDIMDANNPNGTPLTQVSTGQVAYQSPGTWVRLAGLFQMPSTTSSIILRIYSNTPNSNGNDLALDDIAFAACGPPISFTQGAGTVCAGGNTSVSVSLPAGSYSSYYFQLQRRQIGTTNWENIGTVVNNGASNQRTFPITNAQAGFEYRVEAAGGQAEIYNANCRVVSDPLEVKVIDYSVAISGNSPVCYNTSTTLTATVTPKAGTGTPATGFTYVWESSPAGASNWSVMPGQTGSSLNTGALTEPRDYRVTASVAGCQGDGVSNIFTVSVDRELAMTLGSLAPVCQGTTSVNLPYTIHSGSPDRYSITSANLPGFQPVTLASLPASPIPVAIPGGTAPGTYNFTITFNKSGVNCNSPAYPFSLTIDAPPSPAVAGPDQDLCAVTSTQLAATPPAVGQGTWTMVSGPSSVTFSDPNSATATVSGLVPGAYVLRWTVANGGCPPVSDDVTIGIEAQPTPANAGPDKTQYNSGKFVNQANSPTNGAGTWTVISGNAVLGDTQDPFTTATLAPNTSATLVWTVANNNCPPSTDTVVLRFVQQADIQIEKTVVENGPYIAGQDFSYRIVVRNAGPSNNPAVLIRDDLPAAFIPANIHVTATGSAAILSNQSAGRSIVVNADIPVGASTIEILVEGKIDPGFEGDLTNTATATSPDIPDPDGASSTVTVPVVRRPFFEVLKRAPSSAVAGEEISFGVRVGNTGLGNAENTVFTDVISPKMSNVRWSAVATGMVSIVSGATGTGSTVSITANYPAGDTGRLYVTVTGTVNPDATGTIENTGTATPSEPTVGPSQSNTTSTLIISSPGLLIDKSGPASHTAIAGGPISYTIVVVNNGPSDAVNTVITDNVPAEISQVQWTATAEGVASITGGNSGTGNAVRLTGNFPAGSSNRIVIRVNGTVSPDFSGTLTNTATATPSEAGADPVSDIESTVVSKDVDLTIVKAGPAFAVAGEQIAYTITVSNTGISNSSNSVIHDLLPVGLSNGSWTATVTQGTAVIVSGASGSGNTIDVTANMNAGSTITIVVHATIVPGATGVIRNTSTVTPSEPGTSPVTSNEVVTELTSRATLTIDKSGPDNASAGDQITYVITVGNAGPSNARNITVTDVVPASVTRATWFAVTSGNAIITSSPTGTGNNISLTANIDAGQNNLVRITVTGTISSDFDGTITNTAIVTPSGTSSTGDTSTKVTTVQRVPVLGIIKSAVDTVLAGDSIIYNIEVFNTSNASAENVVITDVVPASISGVSWTASRSGLAIVTSGATGTGNNVSVTANIPAGPVHRILITVKGKTSPATSGQIENIATATPSEPGASAVSDTATVVVQRIPELIIQKTGPAKLSAGQQIVYTISVRNNSPSDAQNVSITDLIPAQVTNASWTAVGQGAATILGGASGTGNTLAVQANIPGGNTAGNVVLITVTGIVDPLFSGSFTNTATATPAEPDAQPVTSQQVTTTVTRETSVMVRKNGPASAAAGETISYTLIVTNGGPSAVQEVQITDALNAVLTNTAWFATATGGATITAGASGTGNSLLVKGSIPAVQGMITVNITGSIRPDATIDTIRNFAVAVSDEAPGKPVNSDTVVTVLNKVPGVLISKTGPSSIFAGGTIVYRVRISNTGPSNARGIVIRDTIPANIINPAWTSSATGNAAVLTGATGSGNILAATGDIAAGSGNEITFTITGQVADNFAGTFTNRAVADPAEPNTPPVTSSVTTNATKQARIRIEKSGPAVTEAGTPGEYVIRVTNDGPSRADNVTIKDVLPPQILQAVWAASGSGGATLTGPASGSGNVLTTASIPPDPSAIITILVSGVLDPAFTGTTFTNTAIALNDPSTTPVGGDTASVTTLVNRVANLRVVKAGPANAAAGEPIEYIIRAYNDGPTEIFGAVFQDIVPASILNVTWTATAQGSVTNLTPVSGNSNNISLTADMPTDGASFIEVIVRGVVSPAMVNGSTISNTASINLPAGSNATDPNPADNSSTVITVIDNDPVVRIGKTGPAITNVGDTIRYRAVISNGGSGNITGAIITDNVPASIRVYDWTATATGTATVTGATSGATNAVSTTGDIPVGTGNTIVLNIAGVVLESAGNTIVNTASVTAGSNKESSVTTSVNRSTDISIQKSGPQAVNAGEVINYVMVIRNHGKVGSDDMLIEDQIPAAITNVTWTAEAFGDASILDSARIDSSGNLIRLPAKIGPGKANNFIVIAVRGIVNPTAGGTAITNLASVTPNDITDYNLPNNQSVVITGVGQLTGLIVRKTGAATAQAGSDISYDVVVINNGPSDATGVNINDVVPPEITNVKWDVTVSGAAIITGPFTGTGNNVATSANIPGGTGNLVIIGIKGTIDPDFAGTIKNIAVVSTPGIPSISDSAVTVVDKQVALKVRKDGPARVTAGDVMQYVITASNAGPANARGAVITDTIDSRLNNVVWVAMAVNGATVTTGATGSGPQIRVTGDLPPTPGAAITIIVSGEVAEDATGTLVNTATLAGSEPGDVPVVSPPVNTVIDRKANLSIVKSGPATLHAGQLIGYTLNVSNAGPSSNKGISITDVVPANIHGTQWIVARADAGVVVNSGQSGTGNNVNISADMPAGTSMLVFVEGRVDSSFAGTLLNTAYVIPSEPGSNPDTSSVQTLVTLQPEVQITKSGPASIVAGSNITWVVTATNNGPSLAKDAHILDAVPAAVTNVTYSAAVTGNAQITGPTSGTGSPIDMTVTIPPGAGHSVTLTINGTLLPDYRDSLFNTAIIRPAEPGAVADTATVVTRVEVEPRIVVEKSGPAVVVAGQPIRYIIRVSNQGLSNALGTVITDVVPSVITNTFWTAVPYGQATVVSGTGAISNNVAVTADIPAGVANGIIITVDGIVAPNAIGTIVNTATATPAEPGVPPANATVSTQVTSESHLSITKTGPAEMSRGAQATYTISFSNAGPSDANGVTMIDTIPDVLENVRWTVLTRKGAVVTNGQSGTGNIVTVTANFPAADTASLTVLVTGTVRTNAPDGTVLNTAHLMTPGQGEISSNTVSSIIKALADVSIRKTSQHEAYEGSTMLFELEIENQGPSPANGAIVRDTIPNSLANPVVTVVSSSGGVAGISTGVNGNAVMATIGTLPPGGKATLRIVATAVTPGTVVNAGLIFTPAGVPDSDSSNNISTATSFILAKSKLAIDKTISPATGPYYPGETLTYTLTARNESSRGVNPVQVTDTLPAASLVTDPVYSAPPQGTVTFNPATRVLTWNAGLVNPFSAVSWSYQVTLKDTGMVRNAASVTGPPDVSTPDTSTVIIDVDPLADLRIVKTGPAQVYVGGAINYRLEIFNDGPAAANGATVKDTLPAGLSQLAVRVVSASGGAANVQASLNGQIAGAVIGTFPNGGSVVLEITGIAPDQPGTAVNTGWVNTPTGLKDSDSSNNRSTSVNTTIVEKNRLEIAKSVAPPNGPYYPGQTLTYTLRATNHGAAAVSPVTVVDTIPATRLVTDPAFGTPPQGTASFDPATRLLTWNIGTLNAGQTLDWTYQFTLKDTGTVRNAVSVTGPPDISTPDTSVVIIDTDPIADLRITKTGPAQVYVGGTVTYQLEIFNDGPSAADGATVKDTLAANLSQLAVRVVSASGGAANVQTSLNGQIAGAVIGTFPNGGSVVLEITGIAPGQPGTAVNTGWVNTPTGMEDSDSSNNRSASVTTSIVEKNRLEIAKSVAPPNGPYYPGQTLTYTLRATNHGAAAVSPVFVVDTIPAARLVSDPVFSAPPQGTASFDAGTRLLTWNAGQLDAGQTAVWTYQLTLKDTGTVRNAASITGPPDISTPDTSVVIVETKQYANLKVMKSAVAPQPLSVGGIIQFTITASNQGPDGGTQIELRDTLAAMLSDPISLTASKGLISFRENGRIIIWTIPAMANGSTETATFTAKLLNGEAVVNSVSIKGREIDIDLSDNRFTIAPIPVTGDDIFIPNTITPNGDGRNDQFKIPGIQRYPGSVLTVYNRWGNLIYQNKNYDNTWDGGGLSEGVYYYILELKTPTGTRLLKGWIELLR